ncbi:hypothetical protein V1511DRAFT_513712 [Dipodascopsis uninucleata]
MVSKETYINAIFQSTVLRALGYIFGQWIIAYKDGSKNILTTPINLLQFSIFTAWAAAITPVMILWNGLLDRLFPSIVNGPEKFNDEKSDGNEKKDSGAVTNTLIKTILTESIFSAVANSSYIAYICLCQGHFDIIFIATHIQRDLPDILASSLKMWPLVTYISQAYISPENVILFRSAFGLLWSVYLTLVTM